MTHFKKREISSSLVSAVESMPVVVLSGMRQTGKSTLLQNLPEFQNTRYATFDDLNTLEAARRNPEAFVDQGGPLIIDEAQKFPEILLYVKRSVDKRRKMGQFILSGSANFLLLRKISESLAGRAVYLTLYPFTRREISGQTQHEPVLVHFLKTGKFSKKGAHPIPWKDVLFGGMPSLCLGEIKNPKVWLRGYEQTYLERDMRSLAQVADLIAFRNLLHLAALRNAQVLNLSELARDAKLNCMTTSRYIDLMEVSFVINRLYPHLRNPASRLIKAPKIYLSDTGLACFLAGEQTVAEHEILKGAMWENYIFQNVQATLAYHCPDVQITYWNIQGRYEVDFVVEFGNKTLAIEVKSGSRIADADLMGLRAFLNSDKNCMGAVVVYNGTETLHVDENIWAVPANMFLS